MLKFKDIRIQDFGPYKGTQVLELPEEDGVIVIYGENGRGKTSLLNAFRYALFGKVKKEGQEDLSLHEISNKESAAEGNYGFKVILRFSYEGSDYELTRYAEPRRADMVPQDGGDYKEGTILKRDNDVLGVNQREQELSRIMPEGVSRFFLFDGELLREYEELLKAGSKVGDEIKEAIEQILGVPILQNARQDLQALRDEARREVQREMKKSTEGEKLAAQLEDLAEQKDYHESEIERMKAKREELAQEKGEIEQFLNQYRQAKEKLHERKLLDERIREIENDISRKEENLRDAMSSVWRDMLSEKVESARKEVEGKLAEVKHRRTASDTLTLIEEAIEDEQCSICEQSLSTAALKRLQAKLDEARTTTDGTPEGPTEEEEAFYARVAPFISNFGRGNGNAALVQRLHDDLQSQKVQKYKKVDRRDELKEQVIDVKEKEEEINTKDNRREEIIEQLQVLRGGIKKEREELQKKEETMRRLEKKHVGYDDEDLAKAKNKRDTYQSLYELFDDGVAAYRDRLRKRVEADASDLFTTLSHEPDYAGLDINENYGLSVVMENGQTISARSSGEGQVVALSLMGALQNNAPLQGPIIMDSSFTRLDGQHKKNVVSALPTMSRQVMLLVFEDELEPRITREQLMADLQAEYEMERVSGTHTKLKPKTS